MRRFAVLGLGRFGNTLALQLAEAGHEVIAVDNNVAHIDAIADRVAHAVILDATDERALAAQGVPDVDCAVVGIGENFEANVLATINCKNFGIPLVVARGSNHNECKILERIGADRVIQPEESSARNLAVQLAIPSIRGYMELMEGVAVCQLEAPQVFHNRTLADIHLRHHYGVNLVAIRRGGDAASSVIYPGATTVVQADDILILVGHADRLRRLAEETA